MSVCRVRQLYIIFINHTRQFLILLYTEFFPPQNTTGFSINFVQCERIVVNVLIRKYWFKNKILDLRLEMTFQKICGKYTLLKYYFQYSLCFLTSNDPFPCMSPSGSPFLVLLSLRKWLLGKGFENLTLWKQLLQVVVPGDNAVFFLLVCFHLGFKK